MNTDQIYGVLLHITAGLALIVTVCLSDTGRADAIGRKSQSEDCPVCIGPSSDTEIERGGRLPVPTSADDTCPVKVGAKLPALGLTTVDGKAFEIHAAVAKSPTVLIFYRGGW